MSKSNKFKCLASWLTRFEKTSTENGMAGWLIKKGIAKNKSTANIELLLITIIFFMMSKLAFLII